MRYARLMMLVAALGVAGCAGQVQPSPSTPAVGGIQLRPVQGDVGCDTIQMHYRTATFEIDAAAAEQVTAVTDTGLRLRTFWSPGFQGGSEADPVVRDPLGQVVAADGDVLDIPVGAAPRLHGYFVCPSMDALYVFLEDVA